MTFSNVIGQQVAGEDISTIAFDLRQPVRRICGGIGINDNIVCTIRIYCPVIGSCNKVITVIGINKLRQQIPALYAAQHKLIVNYI